MNEALFQTAVDAIYDAASTPEAWGPALNRLSEFFGCTIATIIERNVRTSIGRGVAVGVDQASQAEFFSVWGNRNPFVQAAQYIRPREIDTDQNILSRKALLKTDYYNGFMKQRDMHSLLRITLQKEDDFHQSISIMGPSSLGEFTSSHIEKCRLFLPHLHRSAKLARQWTVATSVIQSINHILELRREGIILLNLHGRIVFANRSARSMSGVRDSFVLRGDRIKALRSGEDAELQRLISGAVYQLQGVNVPRGDVMRLSRSTGARDYAVVVSPVPTKGLAIHDNHSVVGCIMIADPQTSKPSSQSTMKKLFKLTPSEAKIADRLLSGDTPEQAATALRVSLATARTHISALFRKADVRRHSEFVRLALNLTDLDG